MFWERPTPSYLAFLCLVCDLQMRGITADQSSTFLTAPLFKPEKSLVLLFPVERVIRICLEMWRWENWSDGVLIYSASRRFLPVWFLFLNSTNRCKVELKLLVLCKLFFRSFVKSSSLSISFMLRLCILMQMSHRNFLRDCISQI